MSGDPGACTKVLGDFESAGETRADVSTEEPRILDAIEGVQQSCEREGGEGNEVT